MALCGAYAAGGKRTLTPIGLMWTEGLNRRSLPPKMALPPGIRAPRAATRCLRFNRNFRAKLCRPSHPGQRVVGAIDGELEHAPTVCRLAARSLAHEYCRKSVDILQPERVFGSVGAIRLG